MEFLRVKLCAQATLVSRGILTSEAWSMGSQSHLITEEAPGIRVRTGELKESRMLEKATLSMTHGQGQEDNVNL